MAPDSVIDTLPGAPRSPTTRADLAGERDARIAAEQALVETRHRAESEAQLRELARTTLAGPAPMSSSCAPSSTRPADMPMPGES
jgi:hypothetical protein